VTCILVLSNATDRDRCHGNLEPSRGGQGRRGVGCILPSRSLFEMISNIRCEGCIHFRAHGSSKKATNAQSFAWVCASPTFALCLSSLLSLQADSRGTSKPWRYECEVPAMRPPHRVPDCWALGVDVDVGCWHVCGLHEKKTGSHDGFACQASPPAPSACRHLPRSRPFYRTRSLPLIDKAARLGHCKVVPIVSVLRIPTSLGIPPVLTDIGLFHQRRLARR